MTLAKRMYWVLALVAILAIAGAGVTLASRLTSAGGSDAAPAVQTCDAQDQDDDANEAEDGDDANEGEDGTDDADEAEDGVDDGEECDDDTSAGAGQIDDGADLLRQASITLAQAIAAAQGAASGDVGEIDLEDYQGKLAFNVEIGGQDVKVDASSGAVLGVGED